MAKNLSDGFASGWTRQAGDAQKEIEARMKRCDLFTDEFSPPGIGQLEPGQNPNKPGFTQAPHDDSASNDLPSAFPKKVATSMGAAGKASDQAMLDELDAEQQAMNVGIKPPSSQFPGGPEKNWKNVRGLSKEIERRIKTKETK